MELTEGSVAPAFSLAGVDEKGNEQTHTLKQYKGKRVILYFYPRDSTPGCTKEAIGFSAELSKIKKGPVTRDEWLRAREYYLGHLAFTMEQTVSRMTWLGERIVTDSDITDPREMARRIKSVTPDDIISLARDIFTGDNINLALVGPVKKADEAAMTDMMGSFR